MNIKLSGKTITYLMRHHKVTMRDIKSRFGINLKRIREVRLNGVTGFCAEEWVFIITGAWPDGSTKT